MCEHVHHTYRLTCSEVCNLLSGSAATVSDCSFHFVWKWLDLGPGGSTTQESNDSVLLGTNWHLLELAFLWLSSTPKILWDNSFVDAIVPSVWHWSELCAADNGQPETDCISCSLQSMDTMVASHPSAAGDVRCSSIFCRPGHVQPENGTELVPVEQKRRRAWLVAIWCRHRAILTQWRTHRVKMQINVSPDLGKQILDSSSRGSFFRLADQSIQLLGLSVFAPPPCQLSYRCQMGIMV